jgi:hypothetical protein
VQGTTGALHGRHTRRRFTYTSAETGRILTPKNRTILLGHAGQ